MVHSTRREIPWVVRKPTRDPSVGDFLKDWGTCKKKSFKVSGGLGYRAVSG